MGLVDKLTELDKNMWHGYEKVTQYCNKELGWDKYDLAKTANVVAHASTFGSGIYCMLISIISNTTYAAPVGAFSSLYSVGFYYRSKSNLEAMEQQEIRSSTKSGAIRKPHFNLRRPLMLGVSSVFLGAAAYILTEKPIIPSPEAVISKEELNNLGGLATLALSSFSFFYMHMSYFIDQIMTPPKKKKSVLKTLYEKITGKLQAAPVPQAEPTKYASIDDVVAQ